MGKSGDHTSSGLKKTILDDLDIVGIMNRRMAAPFTEFFRFGGRK